MQAYKDLMFTVLKNLNRENSNITTEINKMLEIEKKFSMVRFKS